MTTVILGGGLAGLQLARLLKKTGTETLVLEGRGETGGLCRSVRRGDWLWDIGPHAFYSRRPEVMENYRGLPIAYRELDRHVRVAHRVGAGYREVGYPFENGLAELPLGQRLECLSGYLRAYFFGTRPFRHVRHWIDEGLGAGIARRFMIPYNEKIWDAPLDEISMGLVKRKIDPEPPWKIFRNCVVSGTVGRKYQARFLYPPEGAGAIPAAVAADVQERVRTGWVVERLERNGAKWRITSKTGQTEEAERVVSTIPLPRLLAALGDDPGHFRFNHTFITAIGLKEGRRFGAFGATHWVFFAGPEVFYRLTVNSNLSGTGLPVLTAEITRKEEAATWTPAQVTSRVITDLLATGVLENESDIGLAECHLERFTYPLQTLGMEVTRAAVEGRLKAQHLHLLGRSGRMDYVNTDGIFLACAALAEELA